MVQFYLFFSTSAGNLIEENLVVEDGAKKSLTRSLLFYISWHPIPSPHFDDILVIYWLINWHYSNSIEGEGVNLVFPHNSKEFLLSCVRTTLNNLSGYRTTIDSLTLIQLFKPSAFHCILLLLLCCSNNNLSEFAYTGTFVVFLCVLASSSSS